MAITITRIRQTSDIDFPVFIAVPHQAPASRWYDRGEELGEYDSYIAGDHDLHRIIAINTIEELTEVATSYTGHQSPRVREIAEKILGYDVEFRDEAGHVAYGSYEGPSVYSVSHAPTAQDYDAIADALDSGEKCTYSNEEVKK